MAKKRSRKTKDSASKRTLNPPQHQPPADQHPQTLERQVGQYTGEGVPSLQKK